jgi:phosphoribosylaminoimidazole carboxylase
MFSSAIMLNILGGKTKTSHNELVRSALAIPTAALHLYGKESKPARKIGHVTIVGSSTSEVETLIEPLIFLAGAMRAERKTLPAPTPISQSASSGLPKPSSPPPLIAVTMGKQQF